MDRGVLSRYGRGEREQVSSCCLLTGKSVERETTSSRRNIFTVTDLPYWWPNSRSDFVRIGGLSLSMSKKSVVWPRSVDGRHRGEDGRKETRV